MPLLSLLTQRLQVVPSCILQADMGQLSASRLIQISAGTAHSVVLTEEGSVYTFGWGANGRLGHGDTPFRRNVPTTIKHVDGM